jgi:hypothetical protein
MMCSQPCVQAHEIHFYARARTHTHTHTHTHTQALFLCMDYLENFIGAVPGFYCICLCCTIYLMLPLFRGAEQVVACVL